MPTPTSGSKPRLSVIMTVYDREPEVLLAVLRSLHRCDLEGVELIVVNDESAVPYGFVKEYMMHRFETWTWHQLEPYEKWEVPGTGFNNPARAFNKGLLLSGGENVALMSSDTLIPPRTMKAALSAPLNEMPYTPLVLDLDSQMQYCGPKRLFPMPWFLCMKRELAIEVGGWDEEYLKGVDFEDNDFVGRAVLKAGGFITDWENVVYHMTHPQPLYTMWETSQEVKDAHGRNRQRTKDKWAGIPFDAECTPFEVLRKPHRLGGVYQQCRYKGDLLERTIEMTSGIVVEERDALQERGAETVGAHEKGNGSPGGSEEGGGVGQGERGEEAAGAETAQ